MVAPLGTVGADVDVGGGMRGGARARAAGATRKYKGHVNREGQGTRQGNADVDDGRPTCANVNVGAEVAGTPGYQDGVSVVIHEQDLVMTSNRFSCQLFVCRVS